MTVTVDVDNASGSEDVPEPSSMCCWATAALGTVDNAEIAIRLVNETESAALNERYRHKAGPTNVLSFPADIPPELKLPLLGDLVICAPIIEKEALEQGKSLTAHWAHMVVHGTLHLLGYDHTEDQAAVEMETLETHIMTGLGFPPPYEPEEHSGSTTSTTP